MSIKNGSAKGILVLDMINDFIDPKGSRYLPSSTEVLPFLQGELKYFRERMRPVIFCQSYDSKIPDNHSEKIFSSISPRADEIVIKKFGPDAFFKTDLFAILRKLELDSLTIVGAISHTSVLITAASALCNGFSIVVPETCICYADEQDHLASLRLIYSWQKGNYLAHESFLDKQ